jgi:hypothetical protein
VKTRTIAHAVAAGRPISRLVVYAALMSTTLVGAQPTVAPKPVDGFQISGTLSAGVGVRLEGPEPSFVDGRNSDVVGSPSANRTGRNADDGNLNYGKGDIYSAPIKAVVDLAYSQGDWRLGARAQAWYDWALHQPVRFGHSPNGYQANTPLTDMGARSRAKFENAILSQASLARSFEIGAAQGRVEAGLVNLAWSGVAPGGALAELDPVDAPARNRPGALPDEWRIAIPAVKFTLRPDKDFTFEGFYQFRFVPNQDPLCGTFLAVADRTRDSCVIGFANSPTVARNDGQALAAGTANYAVSRLLEQGKGGGVGLLGRLQLPQHKAELVGALVRYDSRRLFTSWVRGTVSDTLVADGLARNPYPVAMYPKDIELIVLGARKEAWTANWYAELARRSNMPLSFPVGEMFQTFTTAAPPTFLRTRRDATPRGGLFQGWDTYHTTDLNAGVEKVLANWGSAARVVLRADVFARLVDGLSDPNEVRYARPEIFGNLQYPSSAPCTAANPELTCTTKGFTSSSAWAYALGAQALYRGVFGSVDLRPAVNFRHDVKGWAYDQSINEGSKTLTLSLDALFGPYTFNTTLVKRGGGVYQPLRDRSHLQTSLSVRF